MGSGSTWTRSIKLNDENTKIGIRYHCFYCVLPLCVTKQQFNNTNNVKLHNTNNVKLHNTNNVKLHNFRICSNDSFFVNYNFSIN
ncbi:hypothetical protein ACH3XW_21880 [Acanthocheilonema viteae]